VVVVENRDVLNFQKLDVYRKALELLELVYEIVKALPRGNAERADQLVRAAEAAVRNIAEGCGRWSKADSAKHLGYARGETMEVASSLDILRAGKLVTDAQYERGSRLAEDVVRMLTKMSWSTHSSP
jgi:four helix bundle protein